MDEGREAMSSNLFAFRRRSMTFPRSFEPIFLCLIWIASARGSREPLIRVRGGQSIQDTGFLESFREDVRKIRKQIEFETRHSLLKLQEDIIRAREAEIQRAAAMEKVEEHLSVGTENNNNNNNSPQKTEQSSNKENDHVIGESIANQDTNDDDQYSPPEIDLAASNNTNAVNETTTNEKPRAEEEAESPASISTKGSVDDEVAPDAFKQVSIPPPKKKKIPRLDTSMSGNPTKPKKESGERAPDSSSLKSITGVIRRKAKRRKKKARAKSLSSPDLDLLPSFQPKMKLSGGQVIARKGLRKVVLKGALLLVLFLAMSVLLSTIERITGSRMGI